MHQSQLQESCSSPRAHSCEKLTQGGINQHLAAQGLGEMESSPRPCHAHNPSPPHAHPCSTTLLIACTSKPHGRPHFHQLSTQQLPANRMSQPYPPLAHLSPRGGQGGAADAAGPSWEHGARGRVTARGQVLSHMGAKSCCKRSLQGKDAHCPGASMGDGRL